MIGGTGFIGARIARRLICRGDEVALYHRGHTQAVLADAVHQICDSHSVILIRKFPNELFDFEPYVAIHTLATGIADGQAGAAAFAGHIGRRVLLSSGDVCP